MNHYKPLSYYSNDLDKLFEKGIVRGVYCGFETLHPLYTVRPASTTYIFGAAFSGKTEFWFEILVNLSEIYGWRHALYTPESGNRTEIMAELISKYCRKHFYKQHGNHISEKEYYEAKAWVGEYFYPIDPEDQDMTITDFFTQVDNLENEYGIKINTTCVDPFNELKHNFNETEADAGRQDIYIENRLGYIRKNAMKYGRHNAVVTHCTDQQQVKGNHKDGGDLWYYPPPTPRQISGGQAWFRKAMNLISVWRPPVSLLAKDGTEYAENEVHISILKYKPKGTGQRGTIKLFYDPTTNRYYEYYNDGKRYAGKQLLIPNQEEMKYEF